MTTRPPQSELGSPPIPGHRSTCSQGLAMRLSSAAFTSDFTTCRNITPLPSQKKIPVCPRSSPYSTSWYTTIACRERISPVSPHVLIFGLGYVGHRLARHLVESTLRKAHPRSDKETHLLTSPYRKTCASFSRNTCTTFRR